MRNVVTRLSVVATSLLAATASAQTSATPPADLSAAVAAPKAADAPSETPPPKTDSTNAAISAGGQFATGNSRLAAISGKVQYDMRRGQNAFAFAVIGNYAESFVTPAVVPGATPVKGAWQESTENFQAKFRYDRYFGPDFSGFLQLTGTHDAFQAITFRFNADPGVKLLLLQSPRTKVWGEAGYDFQYDINYTDSSGFEQAGAGGQSVDGTGLPYVIQQNDSIHSGRLFAGFQHAFNKEVQLNFGLEFLQGFGGSGGGTPTIPSGSTATLPGPNSTLKQVDPVSISLTGSRVNMDILLAAKLGAGLSFGVGFSSKYNSAPLAGKQNLDTSTTMTLIYAFSGAPAAKDPEPTPPAPAPPPAAAPVAAPTPAIPSTP
jgi:putative salt-induced outer membrane protein